MNLIPSMKYLLVCECDEPFCGGKYSGIDVSPAFSAAPIRASLVLATDPDSTMPWARVGAVVFHKKGDEIGMLMAEGSESPEMNALLHENQVMSYIKPEYATHVKPKKMGALALMDLVRRVNSNHPNHALTNGGGRVVE